MISAIGKFIDRKYDKNPHIHRFPFEKDFPVNSGTEEIKHLFQADTKKAKDEFNWASSADINNPELFGYYKESYQGLHQTLEETGKYLNCGLKKC